MNWLLDILLVAIIIGTVCFYWKRGFVKAILSFGRTLVSALVAWIFGPKVGNVIAKRVIGNKITQKVYDTMAAIFDSAAESFNLSELFERAPENFIKILERFGGSVEELEAKYGSMTEATHETLFELAQSIADPITKLLSNVAGFLIIFLITFLLFFVFTGILSKIFELPVLKQINHLLGFLLGVLLAALYAVLFCVIGSYLLRLIGSASGKFVAEELISSTHLFRLIAKIKLF